MYKFLHYFTKINMAVLLICLVYFIIKYTIGLIIYLIFGEHMPLELICITISIYVCLKYVKFGSPYERYIK